MLLKTTNIKYYIIYNIHTKDLVQIHKDDVCPAAGSVSSCVPFLADSDRNVLLLYFISSKS